MASTAINGDSQVDVKISKQLFGLSVAFSLPGSHMLELPST
jgi:hypothetical protein